MRDNKKVMLNIVQELWTDKKKGPRVAGQVGYHRPLSSNLTKPLYIRKVIYIYIGNVYCQLAVNSVLGLVAIYFWSSIMLDLKYY